MPTVKLHDVNDVEAFVRDAIRDGKVRLTIEEHEDLLAEGMLIMVRLAKAYEPGRGGLDPRGSRFSGYAAKYLRVKLGDAFHRGQEHHQLRTGKDGKRRWHYDEKAESLNDLRTGINPTRHDRMDLEDPANHVKALQVTDAYDTDMAATLRDALNRRWEHDRELTVNLGIKMGEGLSAGEAARALGVDGRDAALAVDRIKRVAHELVEA